MVIQPSNFSQAFVRNDLVIQTLNFKSHCYDKMSRMLEHLWHFYKAVTYLMFYKIFRTEVAATMAKLCGFQKSLNALEQKTVSVGLRPAVTMFEPSNGEWI